jgi:aspartyl-tRNA(Asn)/glutamyl-tRNA(Gln) amidotransferase subunit A
MIENLTIEKARVSLDKGEFSALDLARGYLENIKNKDGEINAFLEVFDDVEEQAKRADKMIEKRDIHPLTGIPIAIKDNILIKGRNVSAASKILEGYKASYDADVISKLKQQGAVFIGRANMDEFAMGGSTENSAFGVTKNPHDISRVPGGSSGGSAAAVAAEFCLGALGSDTGGSVRQPAALCGVVGLKSTYGTVSRSGLIAMGSSLDQIGPLTKTVGDAKIIFDAIKGYDKKDSTSLPNDFFSDTKFPKPKTIGVPRNFLEKGVDKDVIENFNETLENLEKNGFEIKDIPLPKLEYALAVYYIIMPAEASTNLARFDGIRYGLSLDGETNDEVYSKTRRVGFGTEVRRRILLGTFVLSSGYVDAYYRKADSVRNSIREDMDAALHNVDAIAMPTSPTPAFKIGEKNEPLSMYTADIFTVSVNLTGNPAISVPSGTVEREGSNLPVGFQIITAHGNEDALFTIGEDIEKG